MNPVPPRYPPRCPPQPSRRLEYAPTNLTNPRHRRPMTRQVRVLLFVAYCLFLMAVVYLIFTIDIVVG